MRGRAAIEEDDRPAKRGPVLLFKTCLTRSDSSPSVPALGQALHALLLLLVARTVSLTLDGMWLSLRHKSLRRCTVHVV